MRRIPEDLVSIRPASVAGVILAGGRARRMGGGDKGRTLIAGRSILARQIEALEPQVAALAINANVAGNANDAGNDAGRFADAGNDAGRFADAGLPVLPDIPGTEGPLAGILAGMEWAAAAGFSRLLTVPCDTPFLPPDLVMRLGREGAAVAASGGRAHPVIGLWPTSLTRVNHRKKITMEPRRVPQCANGARAFRRCPRLARPRSRVIFVVAAVSSMKTSRCGSRRILG